MITSKDCWFDTTCKKYKDTCGQCKKDNNFCPKLFKLDYLYTQALIPEDQKETKLIRFDGVDDEKFKVLNSICYNTNSFVENGYNLYIHSQHCGNGKTTWAIKIMQCYFKSIWANSDLQCKGLFIKVPYFLSCLKANLSSPNEYAQHIIDNVNKADLVIWDEIGIKDLTEFEHEQLLNFIDFRINNKKSNIYTSNLSNDNLDKVMGTRLYSRIVNLSTDVEFLGKDKRGL